MTLLFCDGSLPNELTECERGLLTHVFLHARLERRYADRGGEVRDDLRRAGFRKALTPDIQAAATARGLTVRQLVTLASIVEKETGNKDERPLVAVDAPTSSSDSGYNAWLRSALARLSEPRASPSRRAAHP